MTKNMKNSFLLLLSITLAACGLAEPSAPYETDPDETPPNIIGSKPLNNGVLGFGDNEISLKLDETIDLASLDVLNAMVIESSVGISLDGEWSFEEPGHELIFTLGNRNSVPANQLFTINFNGEITDTSGNPLIAKRQFSTPPLFSIKITQVTGLANDDSLEITQLLAGNTEADVVTLAGDSEDISISIGLKKGDVYSLAITQAAEKSFCTLSASNGEIVSRNVDIKVNCHNVMPAYPTYSKWNQYHDQRPNAHGGVLKKVTFQSSLRCNELSANDALDAFNWACSREDATNEVTFFSSGLKANKGLSDLVNFGTSADWKSNRLIVKQGNIEIYETSEGVWWTNRVVAISNEFNLTDKGTIYLIQEGSNLTRSIHVNGAGIALLISNGINFRPANKEYGIRVSKDATWIEGRINAAAIGMQVADATLTILRGVTVENSRGDGFEILNAPMTQIINGESTNNSGNGIYINTSRLSEIRNTTSSKNKLSGITLASSLTTTIGVTSSNNEGDGIVITGSDNRVFNTSSNNNVGDGLVILGDNNMINAITLASNAGNGLQFKQSGSGINSARNNLIRDITIADNAEKGVFFDRLEDEAHSGNRLINVLDAHNLTSECPNTACDNVTTVSEADISLADLFSVGDDSWQLNSASTYALNQLNLENIEPANTHTFLGLPEKTFLNNAREILGDKIGNDNSLCEANENCFFTPNIGNYQGHGNVISLENSANSLSATLFEFSENGR